MLRRAVSQVAKTVQVPSSVGVSATRAFASQSSDSLKPKTAAVSSHKVTEVDGLQVPSFTVLHDNFAIEGLPEFFKKRPDAFQSTEMMDEVQKFARSTEAPSDLRLSDDYEDAKRQARHLYRRILRQTPRLLLQYNMYEIPPQQAVRSIRSYFEKHKGVVTDAAVMDKLRWQGEVIFSDLIRLYFTYSHVMALIFPTPEYLPPLPATAAAATSAPPSSEFLDEFLSNTTRTVKAASHKHHNMPDRY